MTTPFLTFQQARQPFPDLHQDVLLDESDPPRRSSLNIYIVCFILLTFIVWASMTVLDEVTVADGQIIPTSLIKSIQHLDGGIVSEILVQEGQLVQEGVTLLRLDGISAQSELEQMRVKEAALAIRAERLRAFGLAEKPSFDRFSSDLMHLVLDQKAIYDMQMRSREDQRAVIEKQIEQQKAQMAIQLGQEKDLSHQLQVVQEQRDMNKQLFEKRLKTRSDYLVSEEEVAKVLRDLNSVMNQTQQTRQAIAEAENRLVELDTRLRNEALTEMGTLTAEMAQVTEIMAKLKDRVKRLEIKAPAKGIVKGLKITTIGGVVQSGVEIMQIVPIDTLEIEGKVHPKDIGNILPDQKVLIKVSAYDYSRFGGLEGRVRSISASTFVDENNKPFYKVFIHKLNKNFVGENPHTNIISPGMVVEANIDTGDKTLLQYLIKPVYNAVTSAFREN
ncbi:MAG: HlyD family type I secretion periplasmic adaptor subunit [Proteobacteria bacterium]|nr:HlyD family type I secretion periplasmic adaptor subunit [Pseudomonadota bacterium]